MRMRIEEIANSNVPKTNFDGQIISDKKMHKDAQNAKIKKNNPIADEVEIQCLRNELELIAYKDAMADDGKAFKQLKENQMYGD